MLSDENKTDIRALRGASSYSLLIRVLRGIRDNERSEYENTSATEYNRGRVSMLNDLIRNFSGEVK